MTNPTGFLEIERNDRHYRPVQERLKHWNEFLEPLPAGEVRRQAERCTARKECRQDHESHERPPEICGIVAPQTNRSLLSYSPSRRSARRASPPVFEFGLCSRSVRQLSVQRFAIPKAAAQELRPCRNVWEWVALLG